METMASLMQRIAPKDGATWDLPSDGKELCELNCKSYNSLPGNLKEQDGYDCPKCNNKGFIAEPRLDARGFWRDVSVECECQKMRKTIRRLNRSGLKNIIRDYTFKSYMVEDGWQKAIKEAAVKFVQDDEHNWFFIGGATGCGKTHICTAIAGHYLKQGKDVVYMAWRDDVVKIRGNADPEVREKAMHEYKTAEVLYIDDLFKTGKGREQEEQRPTVGDINAAFELLNYRYNNPQLITIISSESRATDILDIDEAVGGRIVERTIPYGYGINIKPDRSKNYRLRGAIEL